MVKIMDKRYIELFTLISQSVANIAEQVMDLHKSKNEEKEYETAQIMRDDFLDLHTKLSDNSELTKADYAKLLVGAIIASNQLENRIKNEQRALEGYKIDIIPKLDQVNNEFDGEKAIELAKELFKIKEEEKSDN